CASLPLRLVGGCPLTIASNHRKSNFLLTRKKHLALSCRYAQRVLETLTGFAVVGLAIAVGYLVGRIDLLGPHARHVLGRLTFFVLSPFLLFVVLSQADARVLFSALLPVSAVAAVAVIAVYTLVAKFVWRRGIGETVIGALAAGQVNSNNIGIP